jgi:hypothetical protein
MPVSRVVDNKGMKLRRILFKIGTRIRQVLGCTIFALCLLSIIWNVGWRRTVRSYTTPTGEKFAISRETTAVRSG